MILIKLYYFLELSSILNFKLSIEIESDWDYGGVLTNGTIYGIFKKLVNDKFDFIIANIGTKQELSLIAKPSRVYHIHGVVYAIPPGKPLTLLEKLAKPFSYELWIYLFLTSIVSFILVRILTLIGNHKTQLLLFGVKNPTPAMNLTGIFLMGAVSSEQVPKYNFSRFIFILYMFLNIIISTAYSGELFDIFQKDLRHSTFQLNEEILKSDFKRLLYWGEYVRYLKFFPHLQNMTIIIKNDEEYEKYLERLTVDPDFKAVRGINIDNLRYRNSLAKKKGGKILHYCPQNLLTFLISIYFKKNSYLAEDFNKEISLLEQNGIMEKIRKKYFDEEKIENVEKSPEPLKLSHLFDLIYILVIGYSLAFIVFIAEFIIIKCHKENIHY